MTHHIDIGIVSRTFYSVPVLAAQQLGLFARAGLDVRVQFVGGAPPGHRLSSGELHIVMSPPEGVIQDVDAGGSLRIIAGTAGRLSHALITQAGITRVEDLRGARLGILSLTEGSFFHYQAMLRKFGMEYPRDYRVVCTGGAPDRHRLLQEGKIDAALQSFPWVYAAEDAGFNNLGEVGDHVPDWQFVTLNADSCWVMSHRAQATAFLRALLTATEWVFNHREQVSQLAASELGVSVYNAGRGWDYFIETHSLTRDLHINRAGLAKVLQSQIEAGLAPHATPGLIDEYLALDALDAAEVALA